MQRLTQFLVPLAAGLAFLFSSSVFATYTDISGRSSGTFTITANGGQNKAVAIVTADITNQVENTFDIQLSLGGLTLVSGDRQLLLDALKVLGVTPSGKGQFVSQSQISFGLDGVSGEQALSGSAEIDGNTASVSLNGHLGEIVVSSTGILRRSDNLVEPKTAPSEEVVFDVNELSQSVYGVSNTLRGRTAGRRGGRVGGMRLTSSGITVSTPTGLSAGGMFTNIGAWAGFTHARFDNDFSRTKYDGHRNTIMGGVDFQPADGMVLGVALGFEATDIDTDFNLGEVDGDGWTLAPYFGMVFNDTWSMDINGGYSWVDTDQFRTAAGTRINSSFDTKRWFVGANINGFKAVNNWLFTGRAGILRAKSENDSYTEINATTGLPAATFRDSSTSLTQLSIGGEVAYSMGAFEPFATATYNYDARFTKMRLTAGPQPANDDDDLVVGGGFNYFSAENGLSASAQYTTRVWREDIGEGVFALTGRWDF